MAMLSKLYGRNKNKAILCDRYSKKCLRSYFESEMAEITAFKI